MIVIEWLVEEFEDVRNGDIYDVHHFDSYGEAKRFADDCERQTDIGLVRDRGNELEGITDRQWAYVTAGKLPERFDWGGEESEGAKVPERYHNELTRYYRELKKGA